MAHRSVGIVETRSRLVRRFAQFIADFVIASLLPARQTAVHAVPCNRAKATAVFSVQEHESLPFEPFAENCLGRDPRAWAGAKPFLSETIFTFGPLSLL